MSAYHEGVFEALADPTRRSILELVGVGPASVAELADRVPVSRPAVSQHLKVLKDAGLVSVHAAGTRRIYSLDPDGLAAVRDYFTRFWTSALAQYAQTVAEDPYTRAGVRPSATEEKGDIMTTSTHDETAQADERTLVRTSVEVPTDPDRAFTVFTRDIDRWWTRAHHVQPGELKEIGVEPRVGGRLWEENDAGDVCAWGRVLTWDPPRTFAFAWLVGPDWAVPAPDAAGSRVTVTFTPSGTGTLVELVHDQLDAHGPGWQSVRDGVASDGGWPAGLRQFADVV